VIDVAPTILEAAGLPEPKIVNGTPQAPIEGVSMLYSFADAKAQGRRKTQYFEMVGNRAIYADGWFAGTVHKFPWGNALGALADDRWELYDTTKDFSLANDLAKQDPERVKKLQALFLEEAAKYHVLPIDDRAMERFNPAVAGRPDLMGGRTSLSLYEGMKGMSENVFINVKNKSSIITADVEIPHGGANGVILAQGGRFGGWSLYMKDGKPAYTYNFIGLQHFTLAAPQALPPGKATIRFEFAYEGPGMGKGGAATLFVNGNKVASGHIPMTEAIMFSADEGADVGIDDGTPVVESVGHGAQSKFTGKILKLTAEIK
jgi:arylsulfatase